MESSREKFYDEDRSGWKWLILLGSFWSHALTWGMALAAGIFQLPSLVDFPDPGRIPFVRCHFSGCPLLVCILCIVNARKVAWYKVIFMDEFGGPGKAGVISIIPSLICTCLTFSGLLSSVLTNRFGHIRVGWAGTLMAFSGLLLSSMATSVWFLYGTFCLIGVGFGLQYLPSVTVLCQYFSKHRPIALGIACSGAPAGTFLMAPFIRMLTNHYGWRGSFVILAAISLNMGVASSLFRPIKLPPNDLSGDVAVIEVFGVTANSMGSILPLVITELVGQESMSDGYGYILIAEGVGCLLGPALTGFMYDATESYTGSLSLAAGVSLFSCALMIALQLAQKLKGQKSSKAEKLREAFRNYSVVSTKRLISVSSGDSGFLDGGDAGRSDTDSLSSGESSGRSVVEMGKALNEARISDDDDVFFI